MLRRPGEPADAMDSSLARSRAARKQSLAPPCPVKKPVRSSRGGRAKPGKQKWQWRPGATAMKRHSPCARLGSTIYVDADAAA